MRNEIIILSHNTAERLDEAVSSLLHHYTQKDNGPDEYWCEFCGSYIQDRHLEPTQITHSYNCPGVALHAAIKQAMRL